MTLMVQTTPLDSQKIHLQIEANGVFSAETARRKANVWLLHHAGNLLRAAPPQLILTDDHQLLWCSDVILTNPQQGEVGVIGTLHTNAETGHILENQHSYPDILLANATTIASH